MPDAKPSAFVLDVSEDTVRFKNIALATSNDIGKLDTITGKYQQGASPLRSAIEQAATDSARTLKASLMIDVDAYARSYAPHATDEEWNPAPPPPSDGSFFRSRLLTTLRAAFSFVDHGTANNFNLDQTEQLMNELSDAITWLESTLGR